MKNILPNAIVAVIGVSCFVSSARADDYIPTIHKAAQLYFQAGGQLKNEYIDSETQYGHTFHKIAGSADVPDGVVESMKALAIQRHPLFMRGRVLEMQRMLEGYYFLKKDTWGKGLGKEAKEKVLAVGALLYGDDYGERYRWAIDETLAYQRLQNLTFDLSGVQKKYPNSYQSQLMEALGIRPQ